MTYCLALLGATCPRCGDLLCISPLSLCGTRLICHHTAGGSCCSSARDYRVGGEKETNCLFRFVGPSAPFVPLQTRDVSGSSRDTDTHTEANFLSVYQFKWHYAHTHYSNNNISSETESSLVRQIYRSDLATWSDCFIISVGLVFASAVAWLWWRTRAICIAAIMRPVRASFVFIFRVLSLAGLSFGSGQISPPSATDTAGRHIHFDWAR